MTADTDPTSGPAVSSRRYPWIAMGVVLLGAYPYVLNLTALGVALPQIAADLGHDGALGVDWVIMSYLVAVALIQPATGWMADRWGRKAVYVVALVVFGVGSVGALVAANMLLLVLARVVQGLGGGAMMPVGLAIVYDAFEPRRRGMALGVWGVAVMAGPALGPPLGGWVTTAWSWRLIFGAMIPLVVVALVVSLRALRDIGYRQDRPMDWRGWVLATVGLTGVIVGARQAPSWGIGSLPTVVLLGGGIIASGCFFLWARSRGERALIDLSMFKPRAFRTGMLVVALLTVAQYARLTFLPVELQYVQERDAAEVGLLLAPAAIGVAATMPLGGWLADRIGARIPAVVGLAIMAAGTWFLAHLTPATTTTELITILVVSGIGTGLATMPNLVAALNSLPNRYVSQASAVRSLNRQIAAALGTAILAAYVVGQLTAVVPEARDAELVALAQSTYNDVFLIAFWFLVLATAAACFLPGRRVTREHQAARAAEHREIAESAIPG